MIDLSRSRTKLYEIHVVDSDPGTRWIRDSEVVIDAPPDSDVNPLPEAQWNPDLPRSGICGAVGPRVLVLPDGRYRIYYSQMLPRPGFPAGANDYANCTTRILSARSDDGTHWIPEPGIRLSSEQGGAADHRVVSSEVVPRPDGRGFRMYYECCIGGQSETNSIRSAVSDDGLEWTVEEGARLQQSGFNYSAPRILYLPDGRCRLYVLERDHEGRGLGIVSAVSDDGGLTFRREPGTRIAQDRPYDSLVAFACEIFSLQNSGYVMYYAGYSQPNRSFILRATSNDALHWVKDPAPVVAPEEGRWDRAKASEMCLFPLPAKPNRSTQYRMVYEACDGTATNERGVWRIASVTSDPTD